MGAMGTYTLFGRGGSDLGGMYQRPVDVPVSAWIYYFQVADIDAAIARTASRGGKLLRGPMPVPSGARVALLIDPQGAVFAAHENPKRREK
jgi:predicted enzyme related to lactoylglutathione lyase